MAAVPFGSTGREHWRRYGNLALEGDCNVFEKSGTTIVKTEKLDETWL